MISFLGAYPCWVDVFRMTVLCRSRARETHLFSYSVGRPAQCGYHVRLYYCVSVIAAIFVNDWQLSQPRLRAAALQY